MGRQALHPPKPLDYLFRSDEDIGGGGIALQALLLTLWVCTSTMLHRALQCVSVHIHRGTCRNRHVVLRQERHAHTEHHDSRVEVSECETSEQELLSFALLASEWTQNAKNIIDMMSFKSKQEVQDSLDCHISFTRLSGLLSRRQNPLLRPGITIMWISRRTCMRECSRKNGAFGVTASHHPAH